MNPVNSSDEEVITRRQPVKIKPRMLPSKSRRVMSNPDNASSIQESPSTQEPSSDTAKIPIILNCFEDDEEDGFFTRKPVFTRKSSSRKTTPKNSLSQFDKNIHDGENDNSDYEPPRKKRDNKKKRKKLDFIELSDSNKDDNEDSELYSYSDTSDELASYFGKPKNKKREAKNTLSEPIERELTPPPELDRVQFMSTMNSLHQTLNQYSEGILAMNSVDLSILESRTPLEIDLDPELRAISQKTVLQVNSERPFIDRSTSYKVEIYVRAISHPSDIITEENRARYDDFEKPMKFILMANDTFEQMINYFCQKKSIAKDDLVITYKNIKVFPRGTPISLGITKDAIMDAFTKDTHSFFRQQKELEQERKMKALEQKFIEEERKENEIEFVGSSSQSYLHLKLQSKDELIEKLKAKKTSTIQAIINRYRTLRNLPESAIVILMSQGENLDPNMFVGDTELEDGDMITVKIN
ncbi:7924_t:CDS:2 [Ambispora gerdemannii]|uniref:7924_t:CDS:1 n=1 Tax=Ambispora gerdemannii TaxID=144530 RepID=A0A9N9GV16_9GLOM|nr:7924_t:CDS:2 [Ambispora gerdemannii]